MVGVHFRTVRDNRIWQTTGPRTKVRRSSIASHIFNVGICTARKEERETLYVVTENSPQKSSAATAFNQANGICVCIKNCPTVVGKEAKDDLVQSRETEFLKRIVPFQKHGAL